MERFTACSSILGFWKQADSFIVPWLLLFTPTKISFLLTPSSFSIYLLHTSVQNRPFSALMSHQLSFCRGSWPSGPASAKISDFFKCCLASSFFIWGRGLVPVLVALIITASSQMTFLWKLKPARRWALSYTLSRKHLSSQHLSVTT